MRSHKFSAFCASGFLFAAVFTGCAAKQNDKTAVTYKVLDLHNFPYASFVNNWDETKEPVRFALISSEKEYNTCFGSAATMGNTKPYTPSEKDFAEHEYLLVSRVIGASEKKGSFKVESVTCTNGLLSVSYSFNAPEGKADYQIKDGFVLELPKVSVTAAVLYENGQKFGEIKK